MSSHQAQEGKEPAENQTKTKKKLLAEGKLELAKSYKYAFRCGLFELHSAGRIYTAIANGLAIIACHRFWRSSEPASLQVLLRSFELSQQYNNTTMAVMVAAMFVFTANAAFEWWLLNKKAVQRSDGMLGPSLYVLVRQSSDVLAYPVYVWIGWLFDSGFRISVFPVKGLVTMNWRTPYYSGLWTCVAVMLTWTIVGTLQWLVLEHVCSFEATPWLRRRAPLEADQGSVQEADHGSVQ